MSAQLPFESTHISSRGIGVTVKPIALLPRVGQLLLALVAFGYLLDNSVQHAFCCDDPPSAIAGRAVLDSPGPRSVRRMLRLLDNVLTGQSQRPGVEIGRIWVTRRSEYGFDLLDLPLAHRPGVTAA